MVDENVRVTRLNVYANNAQKPIPYYVLGSVSDDVIHEMEISITQRLKQDKFVGVTECVIEFFNAHDIVMCYLNY